MSDSVISLGGHSVPGFALADQAATVSDGGTVKMASVMTGATAGLLAYVLNVPTWGALVIGAGAAIATKISIDKAA
jgi:hypothetical protein